MNSTANTSENDLLKVGIPTKLKFIAWLSDKGLVFAVMGIVCWGMYSLIIEDRRERNEQIKTQNEQIKDLRRIVDDCASAKRDQLELDVQAINIKVDKILTHQKIE